MDSSRTNNTQLCKNPDVGANKEQTQLISKEQAAVEWLLEIEKEFGYQRITGKIVEMYQRKKKQKVSRILLAKRDLVVENVLK